MATRASSDTQDAAAYLAGSGWLASTPPDFASAILDMAHWRRFGPGESIFHAGDSNADLLGLAMGTAALTSALGAADAPVAHIVTAPFWFGYAPLINHRSRILSTTARSPVLVAQVRQGALKQLLADNPGHWQYIAMLAQSGTETSLNIATDLMIRSSRRRCAATLLRIAGCRFADTPPPSIAWTNQEELGGIANMARSTLNLILGELETEGLISRGYNQIILHNPAALRAIADG
jgi:CRP/FNR family transcriptional regulator, cyclic AMP receptor protein